jgi:hypothetical protein
LAANGHRAALRDHDWTRLSIDFVRVMGTLVDQVRADPRESAGKVSLGSTQGHQRSGERQQAHLP